MTRVLWKSITAWHRHCRSNVMARRVHGWVDRWHNRQRFQYQRRNPSNNTFKTLLSQQAFFDWFLILFLFLISCSQHLQFQLDSIVNLVNRQQWPTERGTKARYSRVAEAWGSICGWSCKQTKWVARATVAPQSGRWSQGHSGVTQATTC